MLCGVNIKEKVCRGSGLSFAVACFVVGAWSASLVSSVEGGRASDKNVVDGGTRTQTDHQSIHNAHIAPRRLRHMNTH